MSEHSRLLQRAKRLLENKSPIRTGFLVVAAVMTLAVNALAVRGGARAIATGRYNDLVSRYAGLVVEPQSLVQELDAPSQTRNPVLSGQQGTLLLAYEDLTAEHSALTSEYKDLLAEHETLVEQNKDLQRAYDALAIKRDRLGNEYGVLATRYRDLSAERRALQEDYDSIAGEYDSLRANALSPPYISVKGREVSLVFLRSDGSTGRWHVPFDSLESSLRAGTAKRQGYFWQRAPLLTLTDPANGKAYRAVDYRAFVDPGPFETVIGALYQEIANDDDFVHEAWFIVTQLMQYSKDLGDTPRYPLETFLEGGGDCEDTAILLASMIKAAPVDWVVDLVYMDADHPQEPEAINHMIVSVDTGTHVYLIETTEDTQMLPYKNVQGWYLRVE